MIEINLDTNDLHGYIAGHKAQIGKDPDFLILPQPEIIFNGIRIKFHALPYVYTSDKDHVLHHQKIIHGMFEKLK